MWGKLYRANIISSGKWVSEREVGSAEDAIFNLYALSACKKFVYINKHLYCYRKTNEQATTYRYRKNLVSQWEKLFSYFREFCYESENPSHYLAALDNRIALGMLGIGLNELSNPENFFVKAKNLRNTLNKSTWKKAYTNLDFYYFPLKWKMFFYLCKFKITELLLILLQIIAHFKTQTAK
jgi:glycosyltransferase EpsH